MFLDKFFEESRFRRICNSNKQSRGGQISGGKLLLTQPRSPVCVHRPSLVGAFSVITNLRMELFEALPVVASGEGRHVDDGRVLGQRLAQVAG